MKLEIIATTLKEALDIEKAGADRIELVTGILEGGLTPSLGLIKKVCDSVSIPVNVMVRPHSKSFYYDQYDLEVIYNDIIDIRDHTKANGIVFGCLDKCNRVDFSILEKVISLKGDLKLTFHRAIDSSSNIVEDFKKLITYDIDHILTSVGEDKVTTNPNLVNEFVKLAEGSNTTLLAGSGLYPDNVEAFLNNVNVTEIHMGSGVKVNRNNLDEIDIEVLSNLVQTIRKEDA